MSDDEDPSPAKRAKRRDGDEVDRRLAELQAELEAESNQAKQAIDESRKGVATSGRRRPVKPREEQPEAGDEPREAPEESLEPAVEPSRGTTSDPPDQSSVMAEVAVETLSGKKPADAALTVVTRHLPKLPSKEEARNAALALTAVALGGWLAWGLIAPVLAFIWTVTKFGLLGGVVYGGYRVYGKLPSRGPAKEAGAEADGTEAEAAEEAEEDIAEGEAESRPRKRTR